MFLAEHTAGATLLLRGGDLRKSMSDYLARRIERHEKIEVIRHVEVEAVNGDRTLTGLRLRNGEGSRDLVSLGRRGRREPGPQLGASRVDP